MCSARDPIYSDPLYHCVVEAFYGIVPLLQHLLYRILNVEALQQRCCDEVLSKWFDGAKTRISLPRPATLWPLRHPSNSADGTVLSIDTCICRSAEGFFLEN